MSRINALALGLLMTLCACSTNSSAPPRSPTFVTAQCPAGDVRVDRSFATAAPVCLMTLQSPPPIAKGTPWGSIATDVGELVRSRSDCLKEVSEWYAAERDARKTGAPGA